MRNRSSIGSRTLPAAVIALTLGALFTTYPLLTAFGQTDKPTGARKINLQTAKDKESGSKAAKPGAETSKSTNPAPGGAVPPAGGAKPKAGEAQAATPDSSGGGLVSFIRTNAVWILVSLGGLLAVVIVWAFMGQRDKEGGGESPFAELGLGEKPAKAAAPPPPQKFSSTKIQASDVNSRLGKSMKTTEVETDREYALVVDEEALKMPPLPDQLDEDKPAGRMGDSSRIEKLLQSKNVRGAYDEYSRQIEAHKETAFPSDVERALGEELLKAKELEKAAEVLEHHMATQTKTEVRPDVYFNLGYIRMLQRSVPESRRYFKLYVESEKNPAYVARAKKLLERMRGSTERN